MLEEQFITKEENFMKNSQNTGEKKKITIDGFNEEINKKGE